MSLLSQHPQTLQEFNESIDKSDDERDLQDHLSPRDNHNGREDYYDYDNNNNNNQQQQQQQRVTVPALNLNRFPGQDQDQDQDQDQEGKSRSNINPTTNMQNKQIQSRQNQTSKHQSRRGVNQGGQGGVGPPDDLFDQMKASFQQQTQGLVDEKRVVELQTGKDQQNQLLIGQLQKETATANRQMGQMRQEMDRLKAEMEDNKKVKISAADAIDYDVLPEVAHSSAMFRHSVIKENMQEMERKNSKTQFPPRKPLPPVPSKSETEDGWPTQKNDYEYNKLIPDKSTIDNIAIAKDKDKKRGVLQQKNKVWRELPKANKESRMDDPDSLQVSLSF